MSKETNVFEIATRKKYRFPFKGMITVEDLWDLSLQNFVHQMRYLLFL